MKAGYKFNLEIMLGNETMREPGHVAWALDRVGAQLVHLPRLERGANGAIIDANGNKVGTWEVK
jgi:hypothetical protein